MLNYLSKFTQFHLIFAQFSNERSYWDKGIQEVNYCVAINEGDVAKAQQQMKDAGAEFVQSVEILEEMSQV